MFQKLLLTSVVSYVAALSSAELESIKAGVLKEYEDAINAEVQKRVAVAEQLKSFEDIPLSNKLTAVLKDL